MAGPRDKYTAAQLDPKQNPNAHHLLRECEAWEATQALYDQSHGAETRDEHVAAAEALLRSIKPHAIYTNTPVTLTMAQTHLMIAQAMGGEV